MSNILRVIFRFVPLPLPYLISQSDDKGKFSGHIDTSILTYITPLMITIATLVLGIIVMNISTLWLYFETNIPLNGLIIFLMTLSLIQAFNNNYQLARTAKFLKRIEDYGKLEETRLNPEVEALHTDLEKKIPLLNTKQMHDVLEKLRKFGHPNFTDRDAMIIKSKLGYRIRLRKSDVGFNAGILVMLGLLGTFLGLLGTIDAVSGALGTMAELGGGGGEITMDDMTKFITTLSGPLEGMGLAFSSSLFGLSGSLLIGFFNHLGGGAQDSFIESTSRWVDNRIPTFKPDADKDKGAVSKPATDDDLKTWLTGYVDLSVKTNRNLEILTSKINRVIDDASAFKDIFFQFSEGQRLIAGNVESVNGNLKLLNEVGDNLASKVGGTAEMVSQVSEKNSKTINEMRTTFEKMEASLVDVSAASRSMADTTSSVNRSFEQWQSVSKSEAVKLRESLGHVVEAVEGAAGSNAQSAQVMLSIPYDTAAA